MTDELPFLEHVDARSVEQAFREHGGFLWREAGLAPLAESAIAAARSFFALPRGTKEKLAIERSPHFRGWSEMKNERDWREQIHFGREREPAGREPEYKRLEGPNLWPPDPGWRAAVQSYMEASAARSEALLTALGAHLGLERDAFVGLAGEGHALLKLIGYFGQGSRSAPRPGVAAHVDFSYVTLTLQDDPGLEVRRPDGSWTRVPAVPGTLWVHPGELLQFATRGHLGATPHRVVNRAVDRLRVSLPFFANPALDARVPLLASRPIRPVPVEGEHVHRVLTGGAPAQPFLFGAAEWDRKGRNVWCTECRARRAEPPASSERNGRTPDAE